MITAYEYELRPLFAQNLSDEDPDTLEVDLDEAEDDLDDKDDDGDGDEGVTE